MNALMFEFCVNYKLKLCGFTPRRVSHEYFLWKLKHDILYILCRQFEHLPTYKSNKSDGEL